MNYQQRINLRENGRTGGAYQYSADAATDVITVYGAPAFVLGDEVCIYTESATPPSPLGVASLYYLVPTGQANKYKVASSLLNAYSGTTLDLTTAGVGRQALSPNKATVLKKLEVAVRDLAKQISDGTLTLATINALDATPAITQVQLDKWVNAAQDDFASAGLAARMEVDIEALLTREIYAQDTEIANAAQLCIKAHARYV